MSAIPETKKKRVEKGVGEIYRTLEMMETQESVFNISNVLSNIIKSIPFNIECHSDKGMHEIQFNFSLFISIMLNLIDNAKEAYQRKYQNLENFKLNIEVNGSRVCISDNSGGFEITDVKKGRTGKRGSGHGVFLDLLLHNEGALGTETWLNKLENGTKISILFPPKA